jgi:hypothetical protein
MIKLLVKTTLLTVLVTLGALMAKAQIGYDYAKYDLGLGANLNKVYGDAETIKNTPSFSVSFNYNQTPYANYIVELQAGILQGGNAKNTPSGRYFKNNYTALILRGQLQGGEIIDYSQGGAMGVLKGLYVSAGFGYMINNIKDNNINRVSNTVPAFTTPGLNKSNELFIPARVGYEFKFFNQYDEPSFKLDLAYQINLDFTDNMDGFTAGIDKDKFSQISIGLKFALCSVISYRKSVKGL